MPAREGCLYGVGVGPGDPELVTLKALRLLRAAPVVAYPAPDRGDSFARTIVAAWLRPDQHEIAVRFPMQPGPLPAKLYDEAAAVLAAELGRGRDVVFLCQGDPLLYGSFIPLLSRLAPRWRTEIVPGISSLTACAAAAAWPLASREESLAVIPATLDESELAAQLARAENAAVIKLGRHFGKLRRVLGNLGLLDGALYVERATLPVQRLARLTAVDPAEVPYFSMALVRRIGPPA
ncbi:MAG: precorrin-2 C(20)-methyltransferase [Alphaproteobacteria bacterium]|nr:precorrin-2 C(20)-methyltransferase [Alphaproteobacteria bacterium]